MTTTTTAASAGLGPRRPGLDRPTAMRLAATEYDRFLGQLQRLSPADWSLPTACTGWDVHAMACHVLGMADMSASPLETVRQMRQAKRAGGLFIDALTALQVAKHVDRSPDDVLARLAVVGPRAARGRRRTPAPIRRATLKDQPVDETGDQTEAWTLGFLTDIILTRDTWMHRTDIAEATGTDLELTTDHDGVLIADVAAEWAGRHGQPCSLTLTGPAGGTWTWGAGSPSIEVDAVQFCRMLAGRGQGDGLLSTRVPF